MELPQWSDLKHEGGVLTSIYAIVAIDSNKPEQVLITRNFPYWILLINDLNNSKLDKTPR